MIWLFAALAVTWALAERRGRQASERKREALARARAIMKLEMAKHEKKRLKGRGENNRGDYQWRY